MYPLDQGMWGPTVRITHLRDELRSAGRSRRGQWISRTTARRACPLHAVGSNARSGRNLRRELELPARRGGLCRPGAGARARHSGADLHPGCLPALRGLLPDRYAAPADRRPGLSACRSRARRGVNPARIPDLGLARAVARFGRPSTAAPARFTRAGRGHPAADARSCCSWGMPDFRRRAPIG